MNIKIKDHDKGLTRLEIEGEDHLIFHYGVELSEQPDGLWMELLYQSHKENPNSYKGQILLKGSSFEIVTDYPHELQIRDIIIEIINRTNQQYDKIQTEETLKQKQYELKEQEKEKKRKIEEDAFKERWSKIKFDN